MRKHTLTACTITDLPIGKTPSGGTTSEWYTQSGRIADAKQTQGKRLDILHSHDPDIYISRAVLIFSALSSIGTKIPVFLSYL